MSRDNRPAVQGVFDWQEMPDAVARQEWDRGLLRARDYAVFQSYGWGEFKRASGWRPLRFVARDRSGCVGAMVQFLLRKGPLGFGITWSPGGPVMQFEEAQRVIDLGSLLHTIRRQAPVLLARFDTYVPSEPDLVESFSRTLRRPSAPLSSGRSLVVDISSGEQSFVAGMTSKHRYYFRKAAAAGLRWEIGATDRNIAALAELHRGMSEAKSLKAAPMDQAHYTRLREQLGVSGITIVTGYAEDRPVTSCLTLDFGSKSFYFVAASNAEGRKISAAYAMVPQLIATLHEKGITHFDFGGVAPESPEARGVDHFKNGFGGVPVAYLGEWEWASVPFLAPAVGLLMRYRGLAA